MGKDSLRAIEKHERSRAFATSCPVLAGFEIILFAKDVALRKHTIKHLFNESEWSGWKLFSSAGNNLEAMRARKRKLETELQCPYFTEMRGRGNAPCGDSCDEFADKCKDYVSDWDDRYAAMTEEAIEASLAKPLWVYWKGKDKQGRAGTFMDFLFPSSFGIHVCSVMLTKRENVCADQDIFMVLTAHKTASSLTEILDSIRDRAQDIVARCLPKKLENADWKETLYLRSWGS